MNENLSRKLFITYFIRLRNHCEKNFPGPYFAALELNTEIYVVNLRIKPEYGKIRARKNSVLGHFSRSAYALKS